MLDGFFDGLQHNWDYMVRGIVPKNWTWSFPVIIPGGYGLTDEIIEYSIYARPVGYGMGDLVNPALKGMGFILTCVPAQVDNFKYGDTSFADITGDIAVDALGFGLSEGIGSLAALALVKTTGPAAAAGKVLVDIGVGMGYNVVVDQTGFRDIVVEAIAQNIQ